MLLCLSIKAAVSRCFYSLGPLLSFCALHSATVSVPSAIFIYSVRPHSPRLTDTEYRFLYLCLVLPSATSSSLVHWCVLLTQFKKWPSGYLCCRSWSGSGLHYWQLVHPWTRVLTWSQSGTAELICTNDWIVAWTSMMQLASLSLELCCWLDIFTHAVQSWNFPELFLKR